VKGTENEVKTDYAVAVSIVVPLKHAHKKAKRSESMGTDTTSFNVRFSFRYADAELCPDLFILKMEDYAPWHNLKGKETHLNSLTHLSISIS